MKPSLASAILAPLSFVRAQDLNSTIVGCVALDCPASTADTANDNCTVEDTSFSYVGLTRIPTTQESLKGLSWTEGFDITEQPGTNRTFQTSFFLGAPPDLNLTNTGACSVFFHGVATSLSFGGKNGTNETSQGTCADAMGSACTAALVSHAKAFLSDTTNTTASPSDRCTALQNELHDHMDKACLQISKGAWTDLASTALTGNASPQPISGKENSTSTCWPVLPKQNQLTHVADHIVPGSLSIADAQAVQFSITPILTVFYPDGNGSIINDVDASLTCVKVLGPSKASVGTEGDDATGSAVSLSSSSTMLVTAGAILASLLI
ncbi:hypothetical protein F4861DRAFT_540607 [Xylaria intraflava]|nr:hypothetical protein F4861DRAFT_540607 [Xylaria intraflava]